MSCGGGRQSLNSWLGVTKDMAKRLALRYSLAYNCGDKSVPLQHRIHYNLLVMIASYITLDILLSSITTTNRSYLHHCTSSTFSLRFFFILCTFTDFVTPS